MVVLIAIVYLFKGTVPLNEVDQVVPKTSIVWGILKGLQYGGLAFAVGFSTIVAIGVMLQNVTSQVQVQCLEVLFILFC